MIQNIQQAGFRFLMLILTAVVGGGFASAAVSADRGAEVEGGASPGAWIIVPGYARAGDMHPALNRRDPGGNRSAVEFDATGNVIVREKR